MAEIIYTFGQNYTEKGNRLYKIEYDRETAKKITTSKKTKHKPEHYNLVNFLLEVIQIIIQIYSLRIEVNWMEKPS